MDNAAILAEVKKVSRQLIADRRHLHRHPELGGEEKDTARYVATRLKKMGIPCRTRVGGYGVVGLITGGQPGKCLALRADMDALPITEASGVSFTSVNKGVMHACGHDAHTAMLLAAAAVLQKHRKGLSGQVKLIFQPSEEKHPGGAKPMIAEGVMEAPPVSAVLALHIAPYLPSGKIGVLDGAMTAQADRFEIVIRGRGGHGAGPHTATDPVVVAGQVIVALQTVVSRRINPLDRAVLTIGRVRAGQAPNIIPETAEMSGTVRTFKPAVARTVIKEMTRILKGYTAAAGASFILDYRPGYPSVINNTKMNRYIRNAATGLWGRSALMDLPVPSTGGEDFAYFAQKVPGALFRLGTGGGKNGLLHNERLRLDEKAFGNGVAVFVHAAFAYLHDANVEK